MFGALVTLAAALAASVWTIAYALQEPLADLLWLHNLRQWDAWWGTIEDMHETLATWRDLDAVAA